MKEFKRFWSPRRDKLIDEESGLAEFKQWRALAGGLSRRALLDSMIDPTEITSKRFMHELIDLLSENKTAPSSQGSDRMARKWC